MKSKKKFGFKRKWPLDFFWGAAFNLNPGDCAPNFPLPDLNYSDPLVFLLAQIQN
jgi:hypothetical protein